MTKSIASIQQIAASYQKAAKAIGAAESRAVRRAGDTVRTAQVRALAEEMNVRAATIRAEVRVRQKGTEGDLTVVHQVRLRGIPLREFIGTRQGKKGTSVKYRKKGARSLLPAVFAVFSKGGHFFGRAARGKKGYGAPHVGRLPIVKMYGPNVFFEFQRDEVREIGEKTWHERIAIELDRETKFALKRAGVL
jgi:hypothetical protein